ncbi:hypothetical protein PMAC_002721 [Pneumocystis sp. 'macacae']|nr:hypothetical protein PMAC_002721 [Pneumocystis sp. 'macacae']
MNTKFESNGLLEPVESNIVLEEITCTELAEQMPKKGDLLEKKAHKMKHILYILKKSYFKDSEFHNKDNVINIIVLLCKLMFPIEELVRYDTLETIPKEVKETHYSFINTCLQCLEILMSFFTFLATNSQINDKITQALATYQIKTDPWTSEDNYNISLRILETWKNDLISKKVLIRILTDYVRPYFSFHKDKYAFTDYKRLGNEKTVYRRYENIYAALEDSKTEPWKTEKPECASIFEWVLSVSQKEIIESHFFLIIPPIVILLEDTNPNFKLRSTRCLHHLLSKCDSMFVKRTGIGNLFWEQLIQCLSYHPPSIHITISIPLLRTSFNNLIMLALLMEPESRNQRGKLYDKIVYAGVFNGMLYSGEQPDMTLLFMEYTRKLVDVMGIYATKHIKMLIPLVSSVLENSFQPNHPYQLVEASKALKTIICVCWPRISPHHPTILKGSVISKVKQELIYCIKALKKIMGTTLDKDFQALMNADANLVSFFNDI